MSPISPVHKYRARVCALFVLVLLAACQPQDAQQPPQGPPPAPTVSVAEVIEREIAEWDEFTGRLEAVEAVEVRPRVGGQIERVAFRHGSLVKKGDLLYVIDARTYKAEYNRAQAELARARNQLDLARVQLARAQKVVGAGGVAKQEVDERAAAVTQYEAQVAGAQAALESARLNVEFTEIRAPIAGRISRAEVTAGNLVAPGTSLLTTIVSIDPIYLYFEGDEQVFLRYRDQVRNGERKKVDDARTPVFIGLANEEGHPHEGYMDFIDNRLDPRTGTIRARAVFANKGGKFTPGLFARVKLVGSGRYRAALVNDRAIGTDQDRKFVLIVGEDGKTQYRAVKLGPLVDNLRIVREGLKAGEVIVVNGLQRVRPGMEVKPNKVPMETVRDAPGAPREKG